MLVMNPAIVFGQNSPICGTTMKYGVSPGGGSSRNTSKLDPDTTADATENSTHSTPDQPNTFTPVTDPSGSGVTATSNTSEPSLPVPFVITSYGVHASPLPVQMRARILLSRRVGQMTGVFRRPFRTDRCRGMIEKFWFGPSGLCSYQPISKLTPSDHGPTLPVCVTQRPKIVAILPRSASS